MTEPVLGPQPVYLPSNEPYLGRASVFHFDQIIVECLKANAQVAAHTHQIQLSDLQKAACQLIPQGINLALTIRELVRQGYLFGALVLLRPLIERVAIVSYLQANPETIAAWQRGWQRDERPSLARMLQSMAGSTDISVARQVSEHLGHIVHGDPVGSEWNLIRLSDGAVGYCVGKVIDDPELCDDVCFQTLSYLIVLRAAMGACFPDA
jgi:hypothetical protein